MTTNKKEKKSWKDYDKTPCPYCGRLFFGLSIHISIQRELERWLQTQRPVRKEEILHLQ